MSDNDREILLELLAELFDEGITDSRREQLESILADDPEAREFYLRYARVHARLESQDVSLVLPQPIPTAQTRSFTERILHHHLGVGVAVALVAVTAVLVVLAWTPVSTFIAGEDAKKDDGVPMTTEIASLTSWHRPEWVEGQAISARDHRITAGQTVGLTSGFVEITYDTGAKVVIEGPAEFTVGEKDEGGRRKDEKSGRNVHPSSFILHPSENSGYLSLGRLVARCDTPNSKGFTIVTPAAEVVDFGTEFGVSISASGEHAIEVLEGAVDVVTHDGASRTRLTAMQSVRFQRTSVPENLAVAQFASPRGEFSGRILARELAGTKRIELADAVSVSLHGTSTDPRTAAAALNWPDSTKYTIRERATNITSNKQQQEMLQARTRLFLKFDVSDVEGSIEQAMLQLRVADHLPNADESPIHIARVTQAWDTTSGDAYPLFAQPFADETPTHIDDDTPPGGGAAVDITKYVQAWADGTYPNHGLVLFFSTRDFIGQSYATEATNAAPILIVTLAEEEEEPMGRTNNQKEKR
ncbi:MAG: DNRLRE domain-containing protein [Pirellulales bacterium]|nr:DNRLRE domain-containing protein [Pirellulales bacterium]